MTDKREEPNEDRYFLRTADTDTPVTPTFLEELPEHAREIGLLIAEWNTLEQKLVLLTAYSMQVHRRVVIPTVFASDSNRTRLESMRGALEILFENDAPRLEEIRTILDEASSLLAQRNKYAHGIYGKSKKGQLVLHDIRDFTNTLVPLHDITFQFDRMKALSHRVGRLLGRRLNELEAARKQLQELEALAAQLQAGTDLTDARSGHPLLPKPLPPFQE